MFPDIHLFFSNILGKTNRDKKTIGLGEKKEKEMKKKKLS